MSGSVLGEVRPGFPRIEDLLGHDGLIARAHPRWESRPGQLEMARAIAERLEQGGALAVEAPTGIGKTLAYLVPAILSGRRVIISTNTKTLQDQIIAKDLPLLEAALASTGGKLVRAQPEGTLLPASEGEIRYALMKGRSNYLCHDRLDRKLRQRELAFASDARLAQIAAWARVTERGDRAELAEMADHSPEWGEVDARAETCLGTRCACWEQCFVVRMRREAHAADLIVVNHHLLLADLALRAEASLMPEGRAFGEIIPTADALIIDEAHALEEIAGEYFGGEVSTHKLARFARDALEWVSSRAGAAALGLGEQIVRAVARAEGAFHTVGAREGRLRIGPAAEPDPWSTFRSAAREGESALEALSSSFEAEAWDPAAEGLARRARALAAALRFVSSAESPDYVYWAERTGRGARIGAAPIEVGDLLAQFLFGVFRAVVMTSATLTTGDDRESGGFAYFLERVGAPQDSERLRLETPFDFTRQAALFVPRDLPLPDDPAFERAIAREGHRLIEALGGGAFFLFTSYRMMHAVAERLRTELPYPMLVQGEAPKPILIQRFIADAPAVLFATASFWEGVDVPGDPLRLVLIDRLPFASPSDPLIAARLERLEARGQAGFSAYQVPQAILRLKQGFGRLVRSREDRGVVAILDRRLHTKAYGRRFLAALPDAARITDAPALSAWLAGD